MDKLTAIKIKYDDGTYSDEIPVSVLSENVEWDSTHTLVDILGSIDVDVTGTIQDQIRQLFNEKVNSSEVAILEKRIDNLIKLEPGSTTGDAELADIRVGADGTVYDNAGDAVRQQVGTLKSDLKEYTGLELNAPKSTKSYINTKGKTVDISSPISLINWEYHVIECAEGDKFTITGLGGNTARLWCFIDVNGNVISVAPPNSHVKDMLITAPHNTDKLVVNFNNETGEYNRLFVGESGIAGVIKSNEMLFKNNAMFEELQATFESGGFDGTGKNVSQSYPMYRIKDAITCGSQELLYVYIKNGYECVVNTVSPLTGRKSNITLHNHFSILADNIRLGVRKYDKGIISEEPSNLLKVYKLSKINRHENYDIVIATYDTPQNLLYNADIVCSEDDAQFIIQASMYNPLKSQKVLMYPGTYLMNEIRENPNTPSGSFGHYVFLNMQNPYDEFHQVLHIDGYLRSVIQVTVPYATTIKIPDSLWESIGEDEVVLIGGEKRNFYMNRTLMQLSNFDVRGKDSKKPFVAIDGYYFANMMIDKVNVKMGDDSVTFGAFTYLPNRKNIGFRGLQGDPYGQSYLKNCLSWRTGTGFDIGGEHFMLESDNACFCRYAFCFSDYDGVYNMQHPMMMLKCAISQCMNSIVLNRYGIPEGTDSSKDPNIQSKLNKKQNIICLDTNTEHTFKTSGMSSDGYEDGVHNTIGVYEVHDNGMWMGEIQLEALFKPVAKGCKNIKVTYLKSNRSGTISERPSVNTAGNFQKFYDTENNKEYMFYNGEWKLLN